MYGTIDANGGQITCVYTGFFQASSVTTFPDPINTEHSVPQSWFDSFEPMKSDIHHLFPTHMDANTARGSLPFGEVLDSQTDDWFVGNGSGITVTSSIPSSNIDAYSEVKFNDHFEPREGSKGNTARAVFYFYTMYPSVGGGITDVASLNTLYQWHLNDPVDALEIQRDARIQQYQGNYNPYVHSPELVATAWGFPVGMEEQVALKIQISPNPARNLIHIDIPALVLRVSAIDMMGKELPLEIHGTQVDISSLSQGFYILSIQTEKGVSMEQFVKE